jgi:hypothetical protein
MITVQQKRPDSKPVDERFVAALCPKVCRLAIDYKTITVEDKEHCFLETLLKGSFSLLAIKAPEIALRVSACNL